MNGNGTYDIAYDDGDSEKRVRRAYIRPTEDVDVSAGAEELDEVIEVEDDDGDIIINDPSAVGAREQAPGMAPLHRNAGDSRKPVAAESDEMHALRALSSTRG